MWDNAKNVVLTQGNKNLFLMFCLWAETKIILLKSVVSIDKLIKGVILKSTAGSF